MSGGSSVYEAKAGGLHSLIWSCFVERKVREEKEKEKV